MNTTTIEWAERTWNPVTGCTPVSEGCENCYAKRMAQRLRGRYGYPEDEPFKVTFHPNRLKEPLKLRKPSRIFVCSMGDLFHEDIPGRFINEVWTTMINAKRHTFIVLTKRPERLLQWTKTAAIAKQWPIEDIWPEHVWLGVTVENDKSLWRIAYLLQIPAAVRFVCCEPMLGPVDMSEWFGLYQLSNDKWALKVGSRWKDSPDWVICGGETGPGARPMHPDWVRSLRDQCSAAGVPFLFKQWGEWAPIHELRCGEPGIKGRRWFNFDPDTAVCKVGRKVAGRLLDGREWDEYPEVKT